MSSAISNVTVKTQNEPQLANANCSLSLVTENSTLSVGLSGPTWLNSCTGLPIADPLPRQPYAPNRQTFLILCFLLFPPRSLCAFLPFYFPSVILQQMQEKAKKNVQRVNHKWLHKEEIDGMLPLWGSMGKLGNPTSVFLQTPQEVKISR